MERSADNIKAHEIDRSWTRIRRRSRAKPDQILFIHDSGSISHMQRWMKRRRRSD